MLKNVDAQSATPKKLSKKVKTILAENEAENKVNVNMDALKGLTDTETKKTALNKALQSNKPSLPEYNLIGVSNLRRTKHIANGKPQTLVLPDDLYTELLVRGIRQKYTWDELARMILTDHVKNNRTSDHLI